VSDCCTPRGYRQLFTEKSAYAAARRYRRRGLDPTSQRIVDILTAEGVAGQSVLEVGGGVGAIQLELLRAGASRATSIELTPTYEGAAAELIAEYGLAQRIERRVVDFVDAAVEVEPADIVVLNRVICCYPDMPRLVGAAADHTAGRLVLSFPKRRAWTRALLAMGNIGMRLARREFHVFIHPPSDIGDVARAHGLAVGGSRAGLFWEVLSATA